MKQLALALMLALTIGSAQAEGKFNGNILNDYCADDTQRAWVGMYSGGFTARGKLASRSGGSDPLCVPDQLDFGQLADLVCNYVQAHPEDRHKSAAIFVYSALSQTWECPPSGVLKR